MRLLFIFSILALFSGPGFSQQQEKNVLYIVDSIPIIEEPKEGLGTLTNNEIDRVEVVKNKEVMEKTGYGDLDGIIYVFTKEFAKRPDSIKQIPTTRSMVRKKSAFYLRSESVPYSGPFIDYYLNGKKQGEGIFLNGKLEGIRTLYHTNGNISDEVEYSGGLPNGTEKRYYPDGSLMQKGDFKNGNEIGEWEMYHPNGQLKQHSIFVNGEMDGESISYYSTGEVKGRNVYVDGVYQKNKVNDKIHKLYNESQTLYEQADFKAAIKKLDKALDLESNWADGYFARGTMKLNDFQFDEAIKDFDKALEIEPYFTNAYSNRAFAIIRKYELGNGRILSKSKDFQVIASKDAEIPESDLSKICADLKKATSLGDDNWMVLDALDKHCKE